MVTMGYLFSFQSGWSTLRKEYKTGKVELKESWIFESATFNSPYSGFLFGGQFRQCLKFGYSLDGVFVGATFPFDLTMRPFLIPWNDLILGSIDGFSISSKEVPSVGISISKRVYDGIKASGHVEHFDGLGELRL